MDADQRTMDVGGAWRDRRAEALQHLRQGRHAAAEAIYRELIHSGEADAAVLATLATLCNLSGRPAEAEGFAQATLAIDATNAQALNSLANTLMDQVGTAAGRRPAGRAALLRAGDPEQAGLQRSPLQPGSCPTQCRPAHRSDRRLRPRQRTAADLFVPRAVRELPGAGE